MVKSNAGRNSARRAVRREIGSPTAPIGSLGVAEFGTSIFGRERASGDAAMTSTAHSPSHVSLSLQPTVVCVDETSFSSPHGHISWSAILKAFL